MPKCRASLASKKFHQSVWKLENREEGRGCRRDQEDDGEDSSRPAVLHSSARKLLRSSTNHMVEADDSERKRELAMHPVVLNQVGACIQTEAYGATHEGQYEGGHREAAVDGKGELA